MLQEKSFISENALKLPCNPGRSVFSQDVCLAEGKKMAAISFLIRFNVTRQASQIFGGKLEYGAKLYN